MVQMFVVSEHRYVSYRDKSGLPMDSPFRREQLFILHLLVSNCMTGSDRHSDSREAIYF